MGNNFNAVWVRTTTVLEFNDGWGIITPRSFILHPIPVPVRTVCLLLYFEYGQYDYPMLYDELKHLPGMYGCVVVSTAELYKTY